MAVRAATEAVLGPLLKAQAQVVTTHQLTAVGLTARVQERLASSGRLIRVGRGVFIDNSAIRTPVLHLRIALAQAGSGAVASHRSAAGLWKLTPHLPRTPHITVPRRRRVRCGAAVIHQSLFEFECVTWDGIPRTSASRTIVEVAALPSTTDPGLRAMVDEGINLGLTAVPKLVDLVDTWPGSRCPGGSRLLAALDRGGYLQAPAASVLERRMVFLLKPVCTKAGVPLPVMEHVVQSGRYRLDFAWPPIRFAVEVDGYLWHHTPAAFEHDATRRIELKAAGWEHMAFTWHHVVHRPDWVAERVLVQLQGAAGRAASH